MGNEQLVSYIESQLKVGVSPEAVRSALLQSGWPEADVDAALNPPTEEVPQPEPAPQPVPPKPAPSQPIPVQPGRAGSVIKTSDIFQPGNEPVFQPRAAQEQAQSGVKSFFKKSPSVENISRPTVSVVERPLRQTSDLRSLSASGGMGWLAKGGFILLGIGVLVGGGWYAFSLFSQNNTLQNNITALHSERDQLSGQNAILAQEKSALVGEKAQLGETVKTLSQELDIFRIAPGTPANSTSSVTVSGTLRGADSNFTLETKNGVVITIKNGSAIAETLKPLVGSPAEITGTHVVGSREITVTAVNGSIIQPVASSSTVPTKPTVKGASLETPPPPEQ